MDCKVGKCGEGWGIFKRRRESGVASFHIRQRKKRIKKDILDSNILLSLDLLKMFGLHTTNVVFSKQKQKNCTKKWEKAKI